ncbi:MAG: alpha/beta hydrolase, partial [Planktomarina sp.]
MMTSAPLHNELARGPDGGTGHWLTCADGTRIRIGVWGGGSKGTVLIFPGRTEYIEKYGDAAREFTQQGYTALAVDWRGQGFADRLQNDRAPGHVINFHDYQQDVAAVVDAAKSLDLPEPYFLVAHSMGGCIGLRAVMEGLPVKAAAFTGPMWGVFIAPHLRAVAGMMAR